MGDLKQQLREQGIVTIANALRSELIEPVRRELTALGSGPGGRTASAYPLNLARHGRLSKLRMVAHVLGHETVRRARAELVPCGWTVSDVIGIESGPAPKPVTPWHADASKPAQQHRIKFYWYLNDVGAENGAFGYVPGSHKLTDHVRHATNAKIQNYDEFRAVWREHDLPPDLAALRTEIESHIVSNAESDDRYTVAAKAATLIVFDERGLHRGGIVSEGHRSVLRVSFMPPRGVRAVAYRVASLVYSPPMRHLLAAA